MEHQQKFQRIKTDFLMLMIAFIWGGGFTAQQLAGKHIGSYLIVGIRFVGAAILLLFLLRFKLALPRKAIWQSAGVGMLLFAASSLQQVALTVSTVGNAGFITGMYVVFLPFFLALFWKKRLKWNVWLAVFLVTVGLFLLTNTGPAAFAFGDVLLLGCAMLFAFQIIGMGNLVKTYDPVAVSCVQFFAAGVAGLSLSVFTESNTLLGLQAAFWPMMFMIFLATGVAFTLQSVAQKHAEPTDAAIFFSMESVFAALIGVVYLDERFLPLQWFGGVLMFTAMVLSQLELKHRSPKVNRSLNHSIE
ncbi:MAG: DMT family transporter [Anaerolineae bacterium]|jgi:drug/metabolite transporter (DMT)-like permease|nr:DMT family transporter [Anaerolineae bacterium]